MDEKGRELQSNWLISITCKDVEFSPLVYAHHLKRLSPFFSVNGWRR